MVLRGCEEDNVHCLKTVGVDKAGRDNEDVKTACQLER